MIIESGKWHENTSKFCFTEVGKFEMNAFDRHVTLDKRSSCTYRYHRRFRQKRPYRKFVRDYILASCIDFGENMGWNVLVTNGISTSYAFNCQKLKQNYFVFCIFQFTYGYKKDHGILYTVISAKGAYSYLKFYVSLLVSTVGNRRQITTYTYNTLGKK